MAAASRPLGPTPAQDRSRQASCCCPATGTNCQRPHRSPAPAPHSNPAPHPSFAHSFLSPCTDISPHKTHLLAASRPPTSPSAHPGMAAAPCSSPQLLLHTPPWVPPCTVGDKGWEEGPHRLCPQGRAQLGRALCPHPWLSIEHLPNTLLSAKTESARIFSLPCPCCRGSPRLHPNPALGARKGTLCDKFVAGVKEGQKLLSRVWGCPGFEPQAGNKAANSPHPHTRYPISSHRRIWDVPDPSQKGTGFSPGKLGSSLRWLCGALGCSG